MWVNSRHKRLRSIYVPVINFFVFSLLASATTSFRTHTHIKSMVKGFVAELDSSPNKRIRIIYDFADSPHTFGDFMVVVMLCRFLALSEYQVVLTVIDNVRREDWRELEGNSQDKRVDELINLAEYLLPQTAKIEVVNKYLPMSLDINLDMKSFYAAAPYFLDLLITIHGWDIPSTFLLKEGANETGMPYIAWHVRQASYDNRRNFTSSTIRNDFEVLQKRFPGYSIMLFSDSAGLEAAFYELTGSRVIKARKIGETHLLPQPSRGYQNAIPLLLGAHFYFQRGGGGMGIPVIFSSVPYIYLCPDKSYFHGHKRGRIAPWSNQHQIFVYLKRNLQTFSLTKLITRLKV